MKLSAQEIADIIQVTRRTVERRANKEGWPYEEIPSPGQTGTKRLYLIERLPNTDIRASILYKDNPTQTPSLSSSTPAPAPGEAILPARRPAPPPAPAEIPARYRELGLARADLVETFLAERTYAKRTPNLQVTIHLQQWLNDYNAGRIMRRIRATVGPVPTLQTLYAWAQRYTRDGWPAICGYRRPHNKGRLSISDEEKKLLLVILLHPNRPTLVDAARRVAETMRRLGRPAPSLRTYMRWCQRFRDRNHGVWVMAREGEKAFNDKCNYYITRDLNSLEVGEVIVADGHTLNLNIINPYTGKPKRMTMVMFYDLRSRMPLGWEIMPTESIQCIHSAVYNAVLTLGKLPGTVILDNGKAFKARIFTGDLQTADLEQAGISGLYARLGIIAHFAWPYNARSKPVERFFGTMNEWERRMPAYTGRDTSDKTWLMKRNEHRLRALYPTETVLTVEEANRLVADWFMEYARRPHAGLDGQTPAEVFKAGRGPGVEPARLAEEMLLEKEVTVSNCQFTLFGIQYLLPELLHVRGRVTARFTLTNLGYAFVFSPEGHYLGMAKPDEAERPMAKGTADYETVKQKIRLQRKQAQITRQAIRGQLEEGLAFLEILHLPPRSDEDLYQLDTPGQAELAERFEARAQRLPELAAFLERLPDTAPEEPEEPTAADDNVTEFTPARPAYFTSAYVRYDWLMDARKRGYRLTPEEEEWVAWFRQEYDDYKDICING